MVAWAADHPSNQTPGLITSTSTPRLKTPYSDGTTHVLFEPLDFIARLAALDCRDAGGRATQEKLPRYPGQGSISPVITAYLHPID